MGHVTCQCYAIQELVLSCLANLGCLWFLIHVSKRIRIHYAFGSGSVGFVECIAGCFVFLGGPSASPGATAIEQPLSQKLYNLPNVRQGPSHDVPGMHQCQLVAAFRMVPWHAFEWHPGMRRALVVTPALAHQDSILAFIELLVYVFASVGGIPQPMSGSLRNTASSSVGIGCPETNFHSGPMVHCKNWSVSVSA